MKEDLGVRVKVATGVTPAGVGKIIFPPTLLRDAMVKRGIWEVVEPQKVTKTSMLKR